MPENTELEGTKKPWLSTTIQAAAVGLLWIIAEAVSGFLGLDIGFLKDGFQIGDLVPAAALIVAIIGRVVATKKIG